MAKRRPAQSKTTEQQDRDAEDLRAARADWELSDGYYADQRSKEDEDIDFEAGGHWTPAELAWKRDKMEPAFVIDQISGPINQVANQPVQRIVVKAVGRNADPVKAQRVQGICRRVEDLSGGPSIYKYARTRVLRAGRGFWRIRADYFSPIERSQDGQYTPDVFEQDIRIEPVKHQASVYEDPRCRMLDFSDARFAIIVEDIEWSEFERRWPKAQYTSQNVFPRSDVGNAFSGWASAKSVRVAERYYIVDEEISLCLLKDGRVVEKTGQALYPAEMIATEHVFTRPRVKWMRFTALEILERADVPGRLIPVVKIVGEHRILSDGTEDCRGMVRGARAPQRLANFFESKLAKSVDEDTYSTIHVVDEAIAEWEDDWVNMHANRPAIVRSKAFNHEGKPLPPPTILQSAPNVAAIAMAATRASMGVRHALGQPDVSPEEVRAEQSGRAIKAREAQLVQTTSHYEDSTALGIALTGRIIYYVARDVYTMPRVLRIMNEADKEIEVVSYRGQGQQPQAQQMAQQGVKPNEPRDTLDLMDGEYSFTFAAGKGYQTGREETVETLTPMIQAFPPMAPKAIPIILKNSDFPGAQELAAALEPEQNPQTVPIEEAQKAQMAIDALTEQLNAAKDGAAEKEAERQTKVQIEQMKIQAEFQLNEQKFAHELQLANLEHQREMRRLDLQHERERESMQMQHEHGLDTKAHDFAHARASSAEQHVRDREHSEQGEE